MHLHPRENESNVSEYEISEVRRTRISKNLLILSCQSDMLNSDRIPQSELFAHDQTTPDIHLRPHENQSAIASNFDCSP